MDAVSLIISALVAGALAAAKDTTAQAVRDAYGGLKGLIQRRFSGKPEAEVALAQFGRKPEVWRAPLEDALRETKADEDPEIVAAAERLRDLLEKTGTNAIAWGYRSVAIGGSVSGSSIMTGDRNKVEGVDHQRDSSGETE